MGIGNMLLLSQCGGYSVAIILSLCVLIPMIFHVDHFRGHCLLYTTGDFIEEDGRFDPKWSCSVYCYLTMFIGLFSFICSLVQLVRMSIFISKGLDSSFLSAFGDVVLCVVFAISSLVNAILVSGGFSTWCSAVTQRFPSCETATVMKIGKDTHIDPSGFFIEIGAVQFGIWTLLVCWVLLLVLAGRKLFIYHERENIIISMARERQRYLANGGRSQGGYTPVDYQNYM
ncbi:transmembrane protein 179-like protein [Dinothrombium tinctorium]|uniref:Transmembrane protein 179-like protein n=1 Tax=Dinothrombium tinctorium TaxID=1965070 RepID=A0A3S5WGT1_9ACAR|nr:transmembrane protein 179-like protein [Dinothrombium tinctorium]RWS17918.1 transmembrane protein 179-like protein [Dinothrombium tinctorium]RWS17937.1 transmembrane protein 179-like protein [Dinothrombium tinctorium]